MQLRVRLHRVSLCTCFSLFLLTGLLATPTLAQEIPPGASQETNGTVRLFLDCQVGGCDSSFFRTEVQFVDWVRDRQDADVHLLVTSQTTGAGGRSYELLFMGRERFDGMVDTLTYISGFDATSDDLRRGLLAIIKIGLMRYVGLTAAAENIVIGLRGEAPGMPGGGGPSPGAMATPEDDPWNFWVFSVSARGGFNGESTFKGNDVSGSFSANRVTEEWKVRLSLSTRYNQSDYDYEDYSTTSVRRDHTLSGELVKSLGPRWSAGLKSSVRHSTYYNFDVAATLAPLLEYNFYPYSESTRRILTLQYALEAGYYDYRAKTVFLKEEETVGSQSLTLSLSLRQPWGSASTSFQAAHFLHDIDLHHLNLFGSLNFRLARGLSLNVFGSVGRIQDRISVGYEDATTEELLLRRRLLETDYQYFTSIGLTYRFGSIFNNVVNPRMGGGGGGMIIMM